jgi:hypothetical protein
LAKRLFFIRGKKAACVASDVELPDTFGNSGCEWVVAGVHKAAERLQAKNGEEKNPHS